MSEILLADIVQRRASRILILTGNTNINTNVPYDRWQFSALVEARTVLMLRINGEDPRQLDPGFYILAIRCNASTLTTIVYSIVEDIQFGDIDATPVGRCLLNILRSGLEQTSDELAIVAGVFFAPLTAIAAIVCAARNP